MKVPKLKKVAFETAIIERYKRREISVEEALVEMAAVARDYASLDMDLATGRRLPRNAAVTATSITGYSGGGKSMIAEYEQQPLPEHVLAKTASLITMPTAAKAPRIRYR